MFFRKKDKLHEKLQNNLSYIITFDDYSDDDTIIVKNKNYNMLSYPLQLFWKGIIYILTHIIFMK
jgi:hypothetical protein